MSRPPVLSKPTLLLSDIHGNAAALQAVLEFTKGQIKRVIALGDHFLSEEKQLGASAPLEVWKILQSASADLVRGASDRALCEMKLELLRAAAGAADKRVRAFEQTRQELGDIVLERVRRLPEKRRFGLVDGSSLLAVHGSPRDPLSEIAHDFTDEEVAEAIDDDVAELIVVGAAHIPFERRTGAHQLIALGSVGAAPEGRVAHFAILEPKLSGGPELALHTLQY